MFRLLHFSDSHLGFRQYQSTLRLEDFANSLDEVARVAIEMKVDAVVDTGDTFDSPSPDPFSVRRLREFAEKLHINGIKFIGIIGNHNRHEVQMELDAADWFRAVTNHVVRPGLPGEVAVLRGAAGSINIVAADWMPSSDLPEFLSTVPAGVDALFLHQSCEHFLPAVSRPELVISQIDGLARYVGVGDVHVTKTLTTPKGTVVGSAGSTEMSKRNEEQRKYVMLVTFEDTGPPRCETIEIKTRGIVTFPTVTRPEQLTMLLDKVRAAVVPEGRQPMVFFSYDRALQAEVQATVSLIKEMGIEIVKAMSESNVENSEAIQEHIESGSVLMNEILCEMFPEGSDERRLALELWESASVEQMNAIMTSFISSQKNEIQENPDNQPLPAPPP